MNKIFTIKLKQEEVDILSNVVSEFLSCIEDRCDGAFTMGYKVDKKLGVLNLFVVSQDLELIKEINGCILSSPVCDIKIIGIPTFDLFRTEILSIHRLLKSSKVLYDKEGSLRLIKKNLESDNRVIVANNSKSVNVKPPLQYIKK